MVSREYPPEVYGGAGVHLEFLVGELRKLIEVQVHCFGADRDEPEVYAYRTPPGLAGANPALGTIGIDVEIAARLAGADVVHSHTWYANLAGHLGALLHGIPHVVTAHSLEPMRPWKAEQLGGGYRLSCWAERTAYEAADAVIAVSTGMRADILDHLSQGRSGRGPHHPERNRHRALPAGCRAGRAGALRPAHRPSDRAVRRPDHPAEGRRAPGPGGCRPSPRRSSSPCAPARRTLRSWPPRSPPRSPSCRPAGTAWSGSSRCCRGRSCCSC